MPLIAPSRRDVDHFQRLRREVVQWVVVKVRSPFAADGEKRASPSSPRRTAVRAAVDEHRRSGCVKPRKWSRPRRRQDDCVTRGGSGLRGDHPVTGISGPTVRADGMAPAVPYPLTSVAACRPCGAFGIRDSSWGDGRCSRPSPSEPSRGADPSMPIVVTAAACRPRPPRRRHADCGGYCGRGGGAVQTRQTRRSRAPEPARPWPAR